MEIIEDTKDILIIRMKSNESLANAIRRSVSDVPVLAIEEVEIFKNDSALYDEVLSHRLGLVPLKTDKGMNEKTKIDFKLVKKGPCTVYSEDLEGAGEVIHNKIPLTILGDDHKIELVATATLGKGTEHAKYVPGLCYYKHILEVDSSSKIDPIVQGSKGFIKTEKKGSKWICDLKDADIETIKEIDEKAVSDSDEMLFIIESYGNMSAKEILEKTIKSLMGDLDDFEKQIK